MSDSFRGVRARRRALITGVTCLALVAAGCTSAGGRSGVQHSRPVPPFGGVAVHEPELPGRGLHGAALAGESPEAGTLAARLPLPSVAVWRRPSAGRRDVLPAASWFGRPIVAPVVDRRDRWLRIRMWERPNGSTGWVHASRVDLVPIEDRIVVDLSSFRLSWYRGDRLLHRFTVGIGQDVWPTPTGHFYVWAHWPQPSPLGAYGSHVLVLSGFSEVIDDWPGGGRFGIHGTSNPANRGHKVSHGCIRVYNPSMDKLRKVRVGTPVLIQQ